MLHVATMLYSGGVERWLDLCEKGRSERLAMDIAVLYDLDGLFAKKGS